MTDRPIIFSEPMVRALLAGRKTQTRRVFRWQGPKGYPHSWDHAKVDNPAGVPRLLVPFKHPDEMDLDWWDHGAIRHYGFADPSDRLWVREAWQDYCPLWDGAWCGHGTTEGIIRDHRLVYRADPECEHLRGPEGKQGKPRKWKPSIFMPRWASRLTLVVTDVRVQRVQEISEEDVWNEGVPPPCEVITAAEAVTLGDRYDTDHAGRALFADLWDRLNAKRGFDWASNPWIAAVSFTVHRRNIADMGAP